MNLDKLINVLKKFDSELVVKYGFGRPTSWRGNYCELAFIPEKNVTVSSMLKHAESAVGRVFKGWKGGEYKMFLSTTVHIANEGECAVDGEDEIHLEWFAPLLDTTSIIPTKTKGTVKKVVNRKVNLRDYLEQEVITSDDKILIHCVKCSIGLWLKEGELAICDSCKTPYIITRNVEKGWVLSFV